MRFQQSIWVAATAAALLAAGCVGAEPPATDDTGRVEVLLLTPQAGAFEVTRVALQTNNGVSADLTRNPQNGQFTGTLLLPAGMHELTGRAFRDAEVIGVSNPVPVDVQAGGVSQVMIQLLDTTGGNQPDFGPILASLSHPASSTAGAEVLFAAQVIDPDGTPVSFEWADDCDDSTFTAPQAAQTGWSKLAPGTCNVTLVASSGPASIFNSFEVVVFPSGTNQGALQLVTQFISAPAVALNLASGPKFCITSSFSADASCQEAFASPEVPLVVSNIDWAGGIPGTVTLSDDCGGSFGVTYHDAFLQQANWLPPVEGGLCRLTVRATNGQGVVGQLSMAVLVREGTPRVPASPPTVFAGLFLANGLCSTTGGAPALLCPFTMAGSTQFLELSVSWNDGLPGSFEFTDGCGGVFTDANSSPSAGYALQEWRAPATAAELCPITVTATNLEGQSTSAVFLVDVFL